MAADLRERVARAIYEHACIPGDVIWELISEDEKDHWRAYADAVLAELGQPQAEPVAWQYRRNDSSEWVTLPHWPCLLGDGDERRPLYAAPQPQAAVPEGWPAGRAARAVWDAATKPPAEPVGAAVPDSHRVRLERMRKEFSLTTFERARFWADECRMIVEALLAMAQQQPRPQASAEDVEAMDRLSYRKSLGVGK